MKADKFLYQFWSQGKLLLDGESDEDNPAGLKEDFKDFLNELSKDEYTFNDGFTVIVTKGS